MWTGLTASSDVDNNNNCLGFSAEQDNATVGDGVSLGANAYAFRTDACKEERQLLCVEL